MGGDSKTPQLSASPASTPGQIQETQPDLCPSPKRSPGLGIEEAKLFSCGSKRSVPGWSKLLFLLGASGAKSWAALMVEPSRNPVAGPCVHQILHPHLIVVDNGALPVFPEVWRDWVSGDWGKVRCLVPWLVRAGNHVSLFTHQPAGDVLGVERSVCPPPPVTVRFYQHAGIFALFPNKSQETRWQQQTVQEGKRGKGKCRKQQSINDDWHLADCRVHCPESIFTSQKHCLRGKPLFLVGTCRCVNIAWTQQIQTKRPATERTFNRLFIALLFQNESTGKLFHQ